jgi:hypothetical protein
MTGTKLTSVDGHRWTFWKRFKIRGQDGGVYLDRLRLIGTPFFSIYLHDILEPDPDYDPHNHPWVFWSFVLRGGYIEDLYAADEMHFENSHAALIAKLVHSRFSVHKMKLGWAHRIIYCQPRTKTLVISGRRQRNWGFFTKRGFVPWQEYVEMRDGMASRKKEQA